MNRTSMIAACALVWSLLAAHDAGAQEREAHEVRAAAVKKLPQADRLAKGSPALKRFLLEDENWGEKLLGDPALQRELARDPDLLQRLRDDPVRACQDPGFVSRVLEYDGVVSMVLGDRRAQKAFEEELRGFRGKLQAAQTAMQRGESQAAAARFEVAAQEAKQLGHGPAQAEALLDAARALELHDKRRGKPENSEQILAWYETALEVGAAPQRSLARNNKGVALLAMGRGSEAIAEFERVDYGAVAESQFPVFGYNLGRAYEKEGRGPQAIEQYQRIVAVKPSFKPAVDRLYGLLRASAQPDQIQAAARLTRELVDRGESRVALENAKGCLDEWKADKAVPAICEVLVRSYVEGRVGPADYAKTEKGFLNRITRGAQDAPTGAYLERFATQLQRVFADELPIDTNPRLAARLFPTPSDEWSAEEISGVKMPEELSRLLRLAGDHYDSSGNSEQALARYLLSWNLDPGNTEALVYVAEMVRRDEGLLADNLIDSLVGRIFERKNASYLHKYKTPQDWMNILRYHVLLAGIFEKRQEWGSSREIASVIFQLEHAIGAEERMRRFDRTSAPSPGLHYRLGQAYLASESDLDTEAWGSFLRAAHGFLHNQNAVEARLALEAARGVVLTGDEPTRELRELENRVRRLEASR